MSFFEELKRRNVFRVGIAYGVAGWVVLQIADLVLEAIEAIEAPAWVLKALLLLAILGFAVALVIAWAYEITPEGIRKESEVNHSQSIVAQTGRKMDRIIIGFLVVAVAVLLYRQSGITEKGSDPISDSEYSVPANAEAQKLDPTAFPAMSEAAPQSIAVLPFVNMSNDPDNEYFSDGIAEEILNVLARIPELKVAARTSAFAFKNTNINIAEIAKDLKVETVLEGSVRKDGTQVRVTAQLIQASDGYHLWSGTFDRELTNIFAIQDEIANSIADALKVTLAIDSGAAGNLTGTKNMQAYDAYLRGTNQWHLRTEESIHNAIRLFDEAIAHDPQFARAHAGLALVYAVAAYYTDIPDEEARQKTRASAEAALAIDPELIEAATALILCTEDLNEQLKLAEKALAMNESFATTHQWYAGALAALGDREASTIEYEKAAELDPRSQVIASNVILQYLQLGQWVDAERTALQFLSWAPDNSGTHEALFRVKLALDDRAGAEQAGRALAKSLRRNVDNTGVYLDLAFEPSKRAAAVRTVLGWPEYEWEDEENPRLLAKEPLLWLFARVGEFAQAKRMLADIIANSPYADWAYIRVNYTIPGFICDAEVQAMFAETSLAPLTVPYPCEELLK